MRTLFIALASLAILTACDVSKFEPINIAVHPSLKICTIKETPMPCEKLGDYLRDTMKAPATREVTVSYAGTESVAKDDTSVEQIADLLKNVGYKNVRAIRYDMK